MSDEILGSNIECRGMKKIFTYIFVLAAISALSGCTHSDSIEKDASLSFYENIRDVDHLVLAQMTVSKMATVQDARLSEAKGPEQTMEAIIDAVKIGDRVAVYSYDTYLESYIDLSEMNGDDISVDESSKHVKITLPKIHTRYSGRDAGIREEHYRVSGLRSDIDPKERAALKERMNKSLLQEMESNKEYTSRMEMKARQSAENFFTDFFAQRGYTVSINFK